jgi:hypothetical protein
LNRSMISVMNEAGGSQDDMRALVMAVGQLL